ncbi:hypothetical protein [Kitasatospora sp. NPDC088783]|uniref:hypothetical protein n=1 Tax=Kitasatospora sp. NPDC088783 TaxID=3364077 RepID=UPI00380E9703
MAHWKITIGGPVQVRRDSPAYAQHNYFWGRASEDSLLGQYLMEDPPPPAWDTTLVQCPHCAGTTSFLAVGDWGAPGELTCLPCGRAFGLDDPVLVAQLLKDAILTGISRSPERDGDAVWQIPAPSLTEAIRPLAAQARTAFASGLWIVSDGAVPFLRELFVRLHQRDGGTALHLDERVDQVQGAVVALHEQAGADWEVRQWLADCGRALSRVASFSAAQYRGSLPYGLLDAEEALVLVSEELRRAIHDEAAG